MNSLPPLALLAGGLATRLRPLTEKIPKSLIEIAGEPFLAHQLRLIHSQGIRKVVICAGYLWEQLRDFAGNGSGFGLSIEYSVDGPTLLGTGGALKKALPMLGNEFFVMYGDSYLPTPFPPIAEFFHKTQKPALMTVCHNQGKWDGSNVIFRNGEIIVYDKHNKTQEMEYIDYGLGIFRAEAFTGYDNTPLDLAEIYQGLLSQGQLAGYEVKERFYEIGSREGIRETDALLRGKEIYEQTFTSSAR